MNPRVAAGGRSFKGAFQYYMHDKDADTCERVAWTHTVNLLTKNPDKAWKVMAYTAKNQERLKEAAGVSAGGRKATKPVMAYSLSWHPDQKPDADHMREVALASLKALGLEDYQATIIAHSDTDHRHLHVVVNRVHPVTGIMASDSYTHLKLSDFALEYGVAHGLNHSPQRAENKKKREEGKMTRYQSSDIAEAWANSDNAQSLIAALKQRGFDLAMGNKRLVVVDSFGKIHNPVRHIEGVDTKAFRDRLAGFDTDALPDAELLAREKAARHETGKAERRNKRNADQNNPSTEPAREEAARASSQTQPEAKKTAPEVLEQVSCAPVSEPPTDNLKPDLAAERLNLLQNDQLEERAALHERFHRKIEKEKEALSKFYQLREHKHQIEMLREKCAQPSLWRRLFGLARRDREKLECMELNYSNAEMRFNERISTLETRREQSVAELQKNHAKQWEVAVLLNQHDERNTPKAERIKENVPRLRHGRDRPWDHGR